MAGRNEQVQDAEKNESQTFFQTAEINLERSKRQFKHGKIWRYHQAY